MAARADVDHQVMRLGMELVQPIDGFEDFPSGARVPTIDIAPNLADLIVLTPHRVAKCGINCHDVSELCAADVPHAAVPLWMPGRTSHTSPGATIAPIGRFGR